MVHYQYKNILFEYREFENCIKIIDAEITQPSINKVFKIPAEIKGKPVTSFLHNKTFSVKNFTDIVIPSTIEDMCTIITLLPMNIYVDTIEHYFKIYKALRVGRSSQLFVDGEKVSSIKLPPGIEFIRGLKLEYIDCEGISTLDTRFIMCDIKKLINTNNINYIPSHFSNFVSWEEPLYFENVFIIDSAAFDLYIPVTLHCPNLVFIESDIVILDPFYGYEDTVTITSNTNPIIYPQKHKINVNNCHTSGNH